MSARVTIDFVAVRAAVYDGGLENKHGIPTSMGEGLLGLGEIGFWEAVKVGGWTHSDRGEGVFALVDRDVHPLVGGFSRVGVSPDGPVRYYADAGVRLKLGPLRPADFVGIGAAFSRVAADPVAMTPSFDEAIVETTYHAAASGWMTLQPDMQLVFQPDRTVFVCGMRATVAF
jgi:hypothetical protein